MDTPIDLLSQVTGGKFIAMYKTSLLNWSSNFPVFDKSFYSYLNRN